MSNNHEQIIAEYENYMKESEAFDTKSVKVPWRQEQEKS